MISIFEKGFDYSRLPTMSGQWFSCQLKINKSILVDVSVPSLNQFLRTILHNSNIFKLLRERQGKDQVMWQPLPFCLQNYVTARVSIGRLCDSRCHRGELYLGRVNGISCFLFFYVWNIITCGYNKYCLQRKRKTLSNAQDYEGNLSCL